MLHILFMAVAGFALAAFEAIMRGPGGRYRLITAAIVILAIVAPPLGGGGFLVRIFVPLMARRYSRRFLAVLIPRRAHQLTETEGLGEAAAA